MVAGYFSETTVNKPVDNGQIKGGGTHFDKFFFLFR